MAKRLISPEYKRRIKKSRQFWSMIRVYGFYLVLIFFMVVGLLLWLRPKESTLEKRTLAQFPSMTFGGLWNGSFFTDIATWYTDTYPMREKMLGGGSDIKNLYGLHGAEFYGDVGRTGDEIPVEDDDGQKAAIIDTSKKKTEAKTEDKTENSSGSPVGTETMTVQPVTEEATEALPDGTKHGTDAAVAGDVFILDGQAFSIYYFGKDNSQYYASMVNTVRSKLPSNVQLYDILAPTAWGAILGRDMQESLGGSSQEDAIKFVYGKIDDSVKCVPAYDNIVRHNAEYIYFRSDHHWTVMGAYYAYEAWCKSKGIEPHPTDYFTKKYEFDGFLGTFYASSNQAPVLGNNPDTVLAFVPNGTNYEVFTQSDGQQLEWNVIRDVSDWARTSKYNCFIGGDNPYTVIDNPAITDGSACILIKESYGNAFAPFLVDHYQHVYVIDYRYYDGNLTQFIKDKNVSDVILLNNMEALSVSRADMILSLFP